MNFECFEHPDKQIYLVDMRKERSYPFSELAKKGIQKYCKEGKRIGIMIAKKGYASGMICEDCGHIPRCDQCDVTVAYHQNPDGSYFGLCHICKRHYPADAECQNCHGHAVDMYGVGAQQVKEFIETTYGVTSCILESNTVNSPKKAKAMMHELSGSQVVIGTTLLTQPIQGVLFDLIVLVQADSGLQVPDYTSQRNCFTTLYDLFSRHECPHFVVQTHISDHSVIRHACQLDIDGFRSIELEKRKNYKYPPFTEMCVLMYKHEVEKNLFTTVNKLHQEILFLLETYEFAEIEVYATPPMIYKMYGKYRYHIILKGNGLRAFLDIIYSKLKIAQRGFKVDWEPMNAV